MGDLLHDLIAESAQRNPEAPALRYRDATCSYAGLWESVRTIAGGLIAAGCAPRERVAVYLPKRIETVVAFFATSMARGVFVPVNPRLKTAQVRHILEDSGARILVTSRDRAVQLREDLSQCPELHSVIITDAGDQPLETTAETRLLPWDSLGSGAPTPGRRSIDTDVAAILYTSGSTGKPKGVVLSHRNMVAGARSVASYLENTPEDRILAVLPFSFDYGFSQLSTAFYVGASVVLLDYLLARDVIKAVAREQITGLAAVPPLWIQLAKLDWPDDAARSLRYLTNSGGALPGSTLDALRRALPQTRPFLMYGLTEAFRSTYLPPEEIDQRPGSMGKAIPNVEVMVVHEDGSPCAPGEPGELVHRGSLVALGYWRDPERTAARFRPSPGPEEGLPMAEIAVWSGDTVRADEDGYLYFVGRRDEMIKTSGYRVSPTEVEEVVHQSEGVGDVAALGIPHPILGQAIVLVVSPAPGGDLDVAQVLADCQTRLPSFMTPMKIITRDSLPRNPNGKIDRKSLSTEYQGLFEELQ